MDKNKIIDDVCTKYLEDLIIQSMTESTENKLIKEELDRYCQWTNSYRQQLEQYLPEFS